MQNEVVSPRKSWEQQQRSSYVLSTCVSGGGMNASTQGAGSTSPEGTAADGAAPMHPSGQGPIVVKATEAPLHGPTATNDAPCTDAAAAVATRAVMNGPATEDILHKVTDLEAVPEKTVAVETALKTATTAEAVVNKAGATLLEPMLASHADSISQCDPRYNPTAAIT